MTLSETDRLEVIQKLSQTLGAVAAVAVEWDRELDVLLDDVANGRAKFLTWEEKLVGGSWGIQMPQSVQRRGGGPMPDEINLTDEYERILDRTWDRQGARDRPHHFDPSANGTCTACGLREETTAHATYLRFTDQPMMVAVEACLSRN
jgi:hypothetical protein